MRIGAGANENDTPNYYLNDGTRLDDFRLYNRVLSSSEIKELYEATITTNFNIAQLEFYGNDTYHLPTVDCAKILAKTQSWNRGFFFSI